MKNPQAKKVREETRGIEILVREKIAQKVDFTKAIAAITAAIEELLPGTLADFEALDAGDRLVIHILIRSPAGQQDAKAIAEAVARLLFTVAVSLAEHYNLSSPDDVLIVNTMRDYYMERDNDTLRSAFPKFRDFKFESELEE